MEQTRIANLKKLATVWYNKYIRVQKEKEDSEEKLSAVIAYSIKAISDLRDGGFGDSWEVNIYQEILKKAGYIGETEIE